MTNVERLDYYNTRGQSTGTDDEYSAKFKALAKDCDDYEQSAMAPQRDRAIKYYYGKYPTLDGESTGEDPDTEVPPGTPYEDAASNADRNTSNKSTYVSTDVKDVIKLILPALVRIYAGTENVVNFDPRTEDEVAIAKQATDYVNYIFWVENPGFLILMGAFKDALLLKGGWVKWWTDTQGEFKLKTFNNIDQDQLSALLEPPRPGMAVPEVTEHGNFNPQTGLIDKVIIKYQVSKPRQKCAGVPPDEMRVDRYAQQRPGGARIIGHVRDENEDVLLQMGYSQDQIDQYRTSGQTNTFSDERYYRNHGLDASSRTLGDNVIYGEWYVRIDQDNDGYAELRHICTMGADFEIVHDEPANRIKFALFQADPVPHAMIGDSVADETMDIQRIKTNVWRGFLDNLVDTLNPRTVANELMVNMEDLMNDDLGAIVRTRGDPQASVSYTQIPFVGQPLTSALQMLDDARDRRTGITDASKGLDPKALQSSTQIGVDAVINGAQERIELIARILAETGFKDLFEGLYNEVCENPNEVRNLRINKQFVKFDTSLFDESMGVVVNPVMGKGSSAVRLAVLQGIKQDQQNVIGQYGLGNGIVGIDQMLNVMEDIMELSNIQNMDRYFTRPPPEQIQAMQQAPKEPDAMTIAAKASYEKVKADASAKIGDLQQKQTQFAITTKQKADEFAVTSAETQRRLDLEAERNDIQREANQQRSLVASERKQ